jgi:hypothetical protein
MKTGARELVRVLIAQGDKRLASFGDKALIYVHPKHGLAAKLAGQGQSQDTLIAADIQHFLSHKPICIQFLKTRILLERI